MQIIENWADVCGLVTGVRPSAARTNWVVIDVLVDSIADVQSHRNLLRTQFGPTAIEAPARVAAAAGVRERVRLCCWAARRTPELIIAHPDHITVQIR